MLTILETDPHSQTGTHNIKTLQGSRYRTRSGRWRFIYEIAGRDVVLTQTGKPPPLVVRRAEVRPL